MQWKGPSDVLATIGANDYIINVKGKEETYNASLLKRFITMDAVGDVKLTGDGSVSAASLAVVRNDDEVSGCDDCCVKFYRSFVAGVARRQWMTCLRVCVYVCV
ncbi:hypothetical protein PoB_006534500 [Plakobranchus ocellatus]|uniref:Uncharacterized protein n=1 Tax=Plakobranchus ocellatus TaxID=259542 RepID=A0AAV4D402_9GAST|nr:hypothetical protein PoB_006534500 [Plakobranchus ocellatus]